MSSPRAESPGADVGVICFAVVANCGEILGDGLRLRSGRGVHAIRHTLARLLTCDRSSQLPQDVIDIRQDSHLVADSARRLSEGVVC